MDKVMAYNTVIENIVYEELMSFGKYICLLAKYILDILWEIKKNIYFMHKTLFIFSNIAGSEKATLFVIQLHSLIVHKTEAETVTHLEIQ